MLWQAAGLHIQNQVQGESKSWLRSHINPPFLEHLSFRFGNQLFYIRIQDVDDELDIPGSEVPPINSLPRMTYK